MIIVYTKDNCPYCLKSKALLQAKGLDFTEKKIGTDITRDEFLELFPNAMTVPQILFNEELVGGYSELLKKLS